MDVLERHRVSTLSSQLVRRWQDVMFLKLVNVTNLHFRDFSFAHRFWQPVMEVMLMTVLTRDKLEGLQRCVLNLQFDFSAVSRYGDMASNPIAALHLTSTTLMTLTNTICSNMCQTVQ